MRNTQPGWEVVMGPRSSSRAKQVAQKQTAKKNDTQHYCAQHPETRLICPRCIAAKGGKTTALRHTHKQLAAWGRAGGRPKKKSKRF
jgi:hypothetical protein